MQFDVLINECGHSLGTHMTLKNSAAAVVAGTLFGLKTAFMGLGIAVLCLLIFPLLAFKIILACIEKSSGSKNPKPPGVGPFKMAVIVPVSLILGLLAVPISLLFSLFYEMPKQAIAGCRMVSSEGFSEAMWFLVDEHSSFSILLGYWLESDPVSVKDNPIHPMPIEVSEEIFPMPLEEVQHPPAAPVHRAWNLSVLRPSSGQHLRPLAEGRLNSPQSPSRI